MTRWNSAGAVFQRPRFPIFLEREQKRTELRRKRELENEDNSLGDTKEMLEAEKDFYVIVQSACGHEQIMDTKVMTN